MRILLVEDNLHLSSAMKHRFEADGLGVDAFDLLGDANEADVLPENWTI